MCFWRVPLKTHANYSMHFFNILKPMLFASRKSLEAKKRQQFVLKPMCQRCKYRRREPRRTWNLAPRRPSDKDNDLHMHAHAASPRPHARHARHARNENEDETKPISRLRGVGQAGLAPLNLRYSLLAIPNILLLLFRWWLLLATEARAQVSVWNGPQHLNWR